MSETRDLTERLRELTETSTPAAPQRPPSRGSKPAATTSSGAPGGTAKGSGTGGGFTGDLVESSFATREYYAGGWKTTDGLFTFSAIKKVSMQDETGAVHNLRFAQPTT